MEKQFLARALATESGGNMILVRGPEILSKWVGESEKAVSEKFLEKQKHHHHV